MTCQILHGVLLRKNIIKCVCLYACLYIHIYVIRGTNICNYRYIYKYVSGKYVFEEGLYMCGW